MHTSVISIPNRPCGRRDFPRKTFDCRRALEDCPVPRRRNSTPQTGAVWVGMPGNYDMQQQYYYLKKIKGIGIKLPTPLIFRITQGFSQIWGCDPMGLHSGHCNESISSPVPHPTERQGIYMLSLHILQGFFGLFLRFGSFRGLLFCKVCEYKGFSQAANKGQQ